MLAETICSAVSAAGLGIAAVTAYRRRFLTATRIAAYSLVPVGLVMTGVVEWLSGIVFQPSVWIGFGLLGLAWVLLATTRAVERRRSGGERGSARAARGGAAREAVAPAASAPSLGSGSGTGARTGSAPSAAAPPAEDFSDIEAILKKHGI
ncbi:hypothetical protein [Streptomyces sp. SPB4]|uniref:hypothetical protein n=1 Tax=Streptomyces TaxID=1883 RepID=UPI0024736C8C|nr:hypothetical protein [Streptomyces sp. SPB4]MDH6539193.1 hypothetical protein [Streptomyces sp. SPB4]